MPESIVFLDLPAGRRGSERSRAVWVGDAARAEAVADALRRDGVLRANHVDRDSVLIHDADGHTLRDVAAMRAEVAELLAAGRPGPDAPTWRQLTYHAAARAETVAHQLGETRAVITLAPTKRGAGSWPVWVGLATLADAMVGTLQDDRLLRESGVQIVTSDAEKCTYTGLAALRARVAKLLAGGPPRGAQKWKALAYRAADLLDAVGRPEPPMDDPAQEQYYAEQGASAAATREAELNERERIFPELYTLENRDERAELLAELERTTPPLDIGNGQWLKNRDAAQREGVDTRTLAKYRTEGVRTRNGMLGRDRDGRVWRKQGTKGAHPYYLKSTLRSSPKP